MKNILRKVINASGRMTKIGVSTQSDYVLSKMTYGAKQYFVMDELYREAGTLIAGLLNANDCVVTSCASSGIVLTVAGLLCKDDIRLVSNLHLEKEKIAKREIIIPKGHSINYGVPIHTMVELGGGILVEAGSSNIVTKSEVESFISENTLALFYVKSHHSVQKNIVTLSEMIELGKKYNIPLIVDAAAEENLTKYYTMGADFVVYSGSKAISGPTSGFILCRDNNLASNIRLQYYGIGRSMKIGKENIWGLVAAIEEYLDKGFQPQVTIENLKLLVEQFNQIPGLYASISKDEAGREIYRCKLLVDEKIFGVSASDLNQKLMSSNPAIYCRDHEANIGYLSFDPRPLNSLEELNIIFKTVLHIGGKHESKLL